MLANEASVADLTPGDPHIRGSSRARSVDSVLDALADPTRRAVLEALRDGPRPVGRIAEGLPVSRPAVSQHLRVLLDAGLVAVAPEGTRRLYGIRPQGLAAVRRYLERFWGDVLTAYAGAAATSSAEENPSSGDSADEEDAR